MTAEKMSVGEMLSVLEAASWALAERDCTTDEFDIARAAVAAMAEREAVLAMKLNDCEVALAGALRREDALIAEVEALRADAERWREVERRYDASKTSAAVMVLQGLGLELTPYRSFAENVDAARTEPRHG